MHGECMRDRKTSSLFVILNRSRLGGRSLGSPLELALFEIGEKQNGRYISFIDLMRREKHVG